MRLVPSRLAIANCEPSGLKATLCKSIWCIQGEQFLPVRASQSFAVLSATGGSDGFAIRTEGDTKHIGSVAR